MTKEQFIDEVTEGLLAPPDYFFTDVKMNKNGYRDLDEVIQNNFNAMSYKDFMSSYTDGVTLLDCRSPQEFSNGFIKGSINIGLKGQYAPWVGALLKAENKILLVSEIGFEKEAITRLARVGYENVIGFLDGGIDSYCGQLDYISNYSSIDAAKKIVNGHKHILDVRKPNERSNGYVSNSTHIRLQELPNKMTELNKSDNILVYCAGGYRSMIACSLLAANGFTNLVNVEGGFSKLSKEDIPISEGSLCSK